MFYRNIVLNIILSIITCGIYTIFWWAFIITDVNRASGEADISNVGVILLSVVTCGIYGIYYDYIIAQKINKAKAERGLMVDPNIGLIYVLLSIFALKLVSISLMQNELNNLSANNQ